MDKRVFDVLHRGHIELFKYAKSLGDYLVVGVDTDERVKASKDLPALLIL